MKRLKFSEEQVVCDLRRFRLVECFLVLGPTVGSTY